MVQPLLSSSHTGWGIGSLDQDAAELRQLAVVLKEDYGSQVCAASICFAALCAATLHATGWSACVLLMRVMSLLCCTGLSSCDDGPLRICSSTCCACRACWACCAVLHPRALS